MRKIQPSKVATLCEPVLKEYIGLPIKINPESTNPYEERYSLVSGQNDFNTPIIAISDRGNRRLRVFPLSLKKEIEEKFWIYFSIMFNVDVSNKRPEYSFNGVSLQVFRGIATDENKELLFRAEWDSKDEDENKTHPHPHWHIHFVKEKPPQYDDYLAYLEIKEEENSFFPDDEITTLNVVKEFNISKFHFAMGVTWYPVPNDKFQLEEASLKGWLSYTLKHIKEQLEYSAS
jgi:hypothetical protein